MLNPKYHLNSGIFAKDAAEGSMRRGFADGLLEVASSDSRAVVLCADVTESLQFSVFKQTFPERFVEMGVAEQNMASVASGLAAMGKVPFIGSYAVFSPGRNWEQIRTTICYNDMPVKIVSSHTGVSVGPDGGSHQALEDIALMRTLPRMTVLSPADATEARAAAHAAFKIAGPVYIRLARANTPAVFSPRADLPSMTAQPLWVPARKGVPDVGIVATGTLVGPALRAAKQLEAHGVMTTVLNAFSIKPLDGGMIGRLAREAGAIVVAEEHQQAGGLGGAVAEFLGKTHPVPIEFVGVDDEFGQSGSPQELMAHYGLTADDIVEAAQTAISRKQRKDVRPVKAPRAGRAGKSSKKK